jgi:3-hydroxyacyl-[acyl-carrier-protein] dehydratase
MAQTAAILVVQTMGEKAEGRHVYFMSIDECRFRRPVTPGDTMRIEVKKLKGRGNVWRFEGQVTVDGQRAAEAKFAAMILDH